MSLTQASCTARKYFLICNANSYSHDVFVSWDIRQIQSNTDLCSQYAS